MNIIYPKSSSVKDVKMIGTWKNLNVYDIGDEHEFNQFVGYIRFLNADNGTVLYRGQNKLYENLDPGIKRSNPPVSIETLNYLIDKFLGDKGFVDYLKLSNIQVNNRKIYRKLIVEAVLQHYGVATSFLDFVDDPWIALWFGINKWDNSNNCFEIRTNDTEKDGSELIKYIEGDNNLVEPINENITIASKEIEKLKAFSLQSGKTLESLIDEEIQKKYKKAVKDFNIKKASKKEIDKSDNNHVFMFLYLADTNSKNCNGLYYGTNTYVLDLRRCLPSCFLRPCAQHGWVVKGIDDYCFEENLICILRLELDLAKSMLGNSILINTKTLFPDATKDDGYKILLSRQDGSLYPSKNIEKYVSEGMIPTIHYD